MKPKNSLLLPLAAGGEENWVRAQKSLNVGLLSCKVWFNMKEIHCPTWNVICRSEDSLGCRPIMQINGHVQQCQFVSCSSWLLYLCNINERVTLTMWLCFLSFVPQRSLFPRPAGGHSEQASRRPWGGKRSGKPSVHIFRPPLSFIMAGGGCQMSWGLTKTLWSQSCALTVATARLSPKKRMLLFVLSSEALSALWAALQLILTTPNYSRVSE